MLVETYVLPEYWLPALINDDRSGLSPDDLVALNTFLQDSVQHHGFFHCLGPVADKDNGYMRYHDVYAYGVGACDTVTVAFGVRQR